MVTVSVRVLIVSWLRQGIVIGQAWLSTQVYIHRTTSSGELDAREYGQCYHLRYYSILSSIDIGVDRVGSRLPLQGRCALFKVGFRSLIFHQDHVSHVMSYDEFKNLCNLCWQKPDDFLVLDNTSDLKNGKYSYNLDTFYFPKND